MSVHREQKQPGTADCRKEDKMSQKGEKTRAVFFSAAEQTLKINSEQSFLEKYTDQLIVLFVFIKTMSNLLLDESQCCSVLILILPTTQPAALKPQS